MKLLEPLWKNNIKPLTHVVVPVVMWRLGLLLVLSLAWFVIPHQPTSGAQYTEEIAAYPAVLQHTAVEDGVWYGRIVTLGYGTSPSRIQNQAFFPLFPYLIKGIYEVTHLSLVWIAFWLNLLLTIGAAFFLLSLARDYFGDRRASRVLWLWLTFPAAFALGLMYTEALFCFLTFGAFWAYRRNFLVPILIAVALLSATKVTGILVGITLALAYFLKKDWKRGILVSLATPVGLLVTMYIMQQTMGDALAFVHVHNTLYYWDKANIKVWESLALWWHNFAQSFAAHSLYQSLRYGFVLLAWFGGVLLTVLGARKLPREYTIFAALNLAAFLYADSWNSMVRYLLPVFPLYFVLAQVQSKEINRAWIVASSMVMAICGALFVTWYWVVG